MNCRPSRRTHQSGCEGAEEKNRATRIFSEKDTNKRVNGGAAPLNC